MTQLLTAHGGWLVRCTEKDNRYKIVISVNWNGELRHVMLRRVRNGWPMPDKVYTNLCDLIESYHKLKMELNDTGVTLEGKAVSRPKWMIPKKNVVKEEKLGEGAFGEVYKGKLRVNNKRKLTVALKTCKLLMSTKEREEFPRRGQADAAVQTQKHRPDLRCCRR